MQQETLAAATEGQQLGSRRGCIRFLCYYPWLEASAQVQLAGWTAYVGILAKQAGS